MTELYFRVAGELCGPYDNRAEYEADLAEATREADATRLTACESCGEMYSRDEMFWCGDMLVSDCCDSQTDPR